MPRVKKIDRPIEKKLSIPKSIHDRVELLLYSELEGRVPLGKWSEFVVEALQEKLKGLNHGN